METIIQDVRHGARVLMKTPALTAAATLALALGIGANTAIFSVVNRLLLRPLPYQNPDRLVMVWEKNSKKNLGLLPASYANFKDLRDSSETFEAMGAFTDSSFNLTGGDEPQRVVGISSSPAVFSILGIKPLYGRTFLPDEDQPSASRVLLMSYGLWQRRFGADPGLCGQTVALNGERYTVVGIMPADFKFPPSFTASLGGTQALVPNADLWLPLRTDKVSEARDLRSLYVVGLLKKGITLGRAQAEMNVIAGRLEKEYAAADAGMEISLVPLHAQVVGNIRTPLLVLLCAVGFVLLIACANVANLQLARAAARSKEFALRVALGATRLRLIQQLITESLLLGLCGGVMGLFIAFVGLRQLVAFSPPDVPQLKEVGVDGGALLYTLAASLLTAVGFGLAPALQTSKPDLNEMLKEGGKGSHGGARRSRLTRLLVVSEVALALTLLIATGLMIQSLLRLEKVDPGFNPSNVVALELYLPEAKYQEAARQGLFEQQLVERVSHIPGIESAATVDLLPFGGSDANYSFMVEGRPIPVPSEKPRAFYRVVSPAYFRVLKIPVLRGRVFSEDDDENSPGVAVINETAARRFWPGEDPVGEKIKKGKPESKNPWVTVVGVVASVNHAALDAEPQAEIYLPYKQSKGPGLTLVARTTSDPGRFAAAIRNEVSSLDSDLPASDLKLMEDLVSQSIARPRLYSLLLFVFATLALALAAVGIYGVVSYTAAQRTHEIGIRMALGAQKRDVLRLIVGQGMATALAGILLGLVTSYVFTRVASSLLYGIGTTDPFTFVSLSLLLAAVALLACYIPARKATRVDPLKALRDG